MAVLGHHIRVPSLSQKEHSIISSLAHLVNSVVLRTKSFYDRMKNNRLILRFKLEFYVSLLVRTLVMHLFWLDNALNNKKRM